MTVEQSAPSRGPPGGSQEHDVVFRAPSLVRESNMKESARI
jgi:hypothetical protein